MTSTAHTLDTADLATTIEARDADGQTAHYRPDAEFTIVDQLNPPSSPRVLRGVEAIRAHLADVCERDMTHSVRTTLSDGDRIAFEVACAYPDGTKVLCMCVAGIVDGRIAWQRQTQVWDG